MPGGKGKLRPEDNPKPWKKGQSGNPNGQPPSIRRQLKELMQAEGVLTIPADQVIKVNDDGSVDLMVSTQLMLAQKLEKWATSNTGAESLKAIQMIMEQIDGKPPISGDLNITNTQPVQLTDKQFKEALKEIKP